MPTQIILKGMEFIVAAYCLDIEVFSRYNTSDIPAAFDPSKAPGVWITRDRAGTGFLEVEKESTPPDTAPKTANNIQAGNSVCNNLTYEAIVKNLFYLEGLTTPPTEILETSHWLELVYKEGRRCVVPAEGMKLPLRVLIWTTFKYSTSTAPDTILSYSLGHPEEIVLNANSPYIINDRVSFGGGSYGGILYGTNNEEYTGLDRYITGASANIKIWGSERNRTLDDLILSTLGRGVSLYVGTDTATEIPLPGSTTTIDVLESNTEVADGIEFSFIGVPGPTSYRHYYPHASHVIKLASALPRPIVLPEPIYEASVWTSIRELLDYSNTGVGNYAYIKTNATDTPYTVGMPDLSISVSVPKKNFVIFGGVERRVRVRASLSIGDDINSATLTPTVTASVSAPYILYNAQENSWSNEVHESPLVPVDAVISSNFDLSRCIDMELGLEDIMGDISSPSEMFIAQVALSIKVSDGTTESLEVVENVKLIINASKGTTVIEPSCVFGTGSASDRIVSASFSIITKIPNILGFTASDFDIAYLYRMSSVYGDDSHRNPTFGFIEHREYMITGLSGGVVIKQKFSYRGQGIYANVGSNLPITVTLMSDGLVDDYVQEIDIPALVYSYFPTGTEFNSTTNYLVNLDGTVSYMSSIGGTTEIPRDGVTKGAVGLVPR